MEKNIAMDKVRLTYEIYDMNMKYVYVFIVWSKLWGRNNLIKKEIDDK